LPAASQEKYFTKGFCMTNSTDYFEYRIKTGDSLSMIMARLYGVGPRSPSYHRHLDQILALNPQIEHPGRIRAGALLRLMAVPALQAHVPVSVSRPSIPTEVRHPPAVAVRVPVAAPNFVLKDIPQHDEQDFWMLSWLAEQSNHLVIPGSIALGTQANLLSAGNVSLIEDISDLYAQYRNGQLSKGQYDYQRKLRLDRLRNNIGPMERLLFGNRTPHQTIRIARGGAIPATQNITQQANRLRRLAGHGKHGGFLLAGVGVAASCMQIANTDSRQEKNEIFVETIASTTVGLAASSVVTLFLISNPVGWGTAFVLAAGTAAVSYGAGYYSRRAYTTSGASVDFVSGLGLDLVCQ
jgi:hypothetical protein